MASTSAAIVASSDNVTINGGVFTLNVTPGDASKLGLEILTNSASPSAFYDSAANQLPLTRNPVVEHYKGMVLHWISSWEKNITPMMWLSGESRDLKSSIARNTAEFCGSDQQRNLLTTFFFSKSDPSRNSAKNFVASLAYGIIQSIPTSRAIITQAVEKDPLIFSASIQKQFDKLILDPLNLLYSTHQDSTLPCVIIINALDECQDVSERSQILRLFEKFYTTRLVNSHQRSRRLPWKVVVTSKLDQTIAGAFGALPTSMASHIILPETILERTLLGRSKAEKPATTKPGSSKIRVQPRGLRLLSIDGGGIRGLSVLVILEEIMHRLKFSMELQVPPKPCEIFDLAGGTGTGGLIVIMLFRLRMSAKAAIDAYARFTKFVFSERNRWYQAETFKASRLEEGVLALISEQLGISIEKARTERMVDENTPKCFVCATPTQNTSRPTLFRTWDGKKSQCNVTISEAARATCTIPTLFRSTEIVDGEIIQTFVDAGFRCNNPVQYVLREAETLAPPSCIVSLGTGLESIIELPKPSAFQRLLPTQLTQLFKEIALDCEKTAEEAAREFGADSDFYFRLNVERGMEDISLEEWERSSEVVTHTKQYLLRHEISRKVDKLVDVLHPPSSFGR